jgi:hypothetical protein
MSKKREDRNPARTRTSAFGSTTPEVVGPSAVSLDASWRIRLELALSGMVVFSRHRGGGRAITRASSADGQVLLEAVETAGALTEASMQLAFRHSDDLGTLKLEFGAVLYLKALFPTWAAAREWYQEATEHSMNIDQPVAKWLNGHCVLCRYYSDANVLELRVLKY